MWAFLSNKKYLGFLFSVVKCLHKSGGVYAWCSIAARAAAQISDVTGCDTCLPKFYNQRTIHYAEWCRTSKCWIFGFCREYSGVKFEFFVQKMKPLGLFGHFCTEIAEWQPQKNLQISWKYLFSFKFLLVKSNKVQILGAIAPVIKENFAIYINDNPHLFTILGKVGLKWQQCNELYK